MRPNATIIENLPDAMAFLQEMEAQDVEIYGGFRPDPQLEPKHPENPAMRLTGLRP